METIIYPILPASLADNPSDGFKDLGVRAQPRINSALMPALAAQPIRARPERSSFSLFISVMTKTKSFLPSGPLLRYAIRPVTVSRALA